MCLPTQGFPSTKGCATTAVLGWLLWGLYPGALPAAEPQPAGGPYAVGVAKVDITPDYPVRLNGFASRRAESEGVRQQLWAKALAIGTDKEGAAVLIAVDNLGVPDQLVQELAARLKKQAGLELLHVFLPLRPAPVSGYRGPGIRYPDTGAGQGEQRPEGDVEADEHQKGHRSFLWFL